ncbi:MAG: transporter related protein [Candidatus Acidoferrum typicum]|nr:transporter related protein [Candidatus Acidoferrum typicum]
MAAISKTAPRWRERLQALKNIPPVLSMVWEAAPKVIVASMTLRVITALLPLAVLKVTQVIIDDVYNLTARHTALPHYFWWLVALEFGLASLAAILVRMINFCDVVLADKYSRHISTKIMEHASHLDLTSFEDPSFYDRMERARVQGTDRIVLIQATGLLIQQLVTTVSLAAGILFFSPWILIALVACVVPAFLGETHFAFMGYSLNFRQTPAKREMEYLRVLGGSKESAKELKLFGLAPFLVGRYAKLSNELHEQTVGLAKRKLMVGGLLSLLGTLGYYGSYAFVIYETVVGALTIGSLYFLTGAIAGASTNIQALFATFSTIADQALFVTDLLDFFAMKPAVSSKPNALPVPRPILEGFEFRNVSFTYSGHTRLVLSDVSFHLKRGERLALVGENGQGKTTIVKLLTRLYDPTAGQILLDGVDLREYDLEDLWRETGVIFQDFMRYDMTAAENIAIGKIEDRENTFRVRSAAQKSLAEGVIRKLPKSYDQILGRRFEGGVDLSGGEWQKMALARAYLRDAQLLILDEPTAALDAKSEHEVFQRFAELTHGKMALLISHRFSTVKMADRILVLEQGQIAEQGDHEELLLRGGRYAEMFELQASSYR